MNKINLKTIGFTDKFAGEAASYDGLFVGRVLSQYKNVYNVMGEHGTLAAEISGKLRFEAEKPSDFPAVGDFVMMDRDTDESGNAVIRHVLPRKSVFVRRAAGTAKEEQVVAANIDIVFICMSLNNDFNMRRLERYLAVGWDSGAIPVVLLTKADLCRDLEQKLFEVNSVCVGVEVIVTSTLEEEGFNAVMSMIKESQTAAFTGSSGVGKSTLINRLIKENKIDTNGLRNDDKGRHTTTRRELFFLPNGGMVIDTPGMRELGLESAHIAKTFENIDNLALNCKFRDCTHTGEPGCAVERAIEEGEIQKERLLSYQKLKREAGYEGLNSRQIENVKLNEMFSGAGGMKKARKFIKEKDKRR